MDKIELHKIWVETAKGETYVAFTWRGLASSGINRAHKEAPQFGVKLVKVWAEPII